MEKFMNWMERYMVPIASKIGAQRHLVAIRDGFATIMPLMIIGSFGLLIHNFPIQSVKDLFAEGQPLHWLDVIALNVYGGSMFLMGLFAAISIGYALGKSYDVDGFATGLVTLASSLVFTNMFAYKAPVTWGGFDAGTLGWEPGIFTKWLGPSGLITILIVTLITGTIFAKLSQNKKLVIKLPDGVPPAVSRSFSALLPTMITLTLVGIVFAICEAFGYAEVYLHVYNLISKPLMGLANSLPVLLGLILIQQLLWFFGLHGSNIVGPVLDTLYSPALQANSEAILIHNTEPIHAITRNIIDIYGMHGGSGSTLGLVIALMIFSKRQEHKELTKLVLAPSVFQINEPVIYGLPIVLDPIFCIPFILVPTISVFVGWFFTAIVPIAGYVYIAQPWVTPPVISAFVATGGSIGATVIAACTFIFSIIAYAPFVMLANKQRVEEQ